MVNGLHNFFLNNQENVSKAVSHTIKKKKRLMRMLEESIWHQIWLNDSESFSYIRSHVCNQDESISNHVTNYGIKSN